MRPIDADEALRLKDEDCNWVYDLTDLFAGRGQMQRGMYLDEIHYTSQGYDLLGKAVLEIATQNLALTGEQAGTE